MNRFRAGLLLLGGGVLAVSCGGGSSSMGSSTPTGSTPSGSQPMVVMVTGINGPMSFSPDVFTVHVGTAVVWQNGDAIVHQVAEDTSDSGGGGGYGYGGGGGSTTGFSTGQIAPGAMSSAVTFRAAGIYSYHCAIHPTMTGNITVTN